MQLMTITTSVPQMELPPSLGGYLTYTPYIQIDDEKREQLTDILVERGLIEEPENADILCDWRVAGKDSSGSGYTHRSEIALYRDGGDGEDPAVLFYRRNDGPDMELEQVHVPPAKQHRRLAGLGLWYQDGTGRKYKALTSYLVSIVNDPAAWVPLDTAGSEKEAPSPED
jgi:hypothetical protein